MWTGKMGNKITDNAQFPYIGYMDTTAGIYTNYSHGLLSAQFKQALLGGQNIQANIGVDAEQVRNCVQNRFIHDMIFIPKKWKKNKNCHIPMLDTENNQYLYRKEQRIKPVQLFLNMSTGAATFY